MSNGAQSRLSINGNARVETQERATVVSIPAHSTQTHLTNRLQVTTTVNRVLLLLGTVLHYLGEKSPQPEHGCPVNLALVSRMHTVPINAMVVGR